MEESTEKQVEKPTETLVEKQVEEDMETSKSLYNQSIESEISQEEADRMALQKTLTSIDNRLTAMEGGKATFKSETLKRILHIRSISGENTAKRRTGSRQTNGSRLVHPRIRKHPTIPNSRNK